MAYFSTTYKGYTITLIGTMYYIAGMPYVQFYSLQGAKGYIDRL